MNKLEEQEIGKSGPVVNVYFKSKKSIYTAPISELNGKLSKQAKLLVIIDGKNRHYMTIKNL